GLPRALFPSQRARASVSRQLGSITTHLPCGAPGCEISTTTSVLLSASNYDDPLREVALDTTHLDVAANRVEQALLVRWPVVPRLVLTPSARVAVERLSLSPREAAPLYAEEAFGRAALGAAWQVHDWVDLRATGSVECHGTSARGTSPWALP